MFSSKLPAAPAKAMVASVREGWQAYLADPSATNTLMHDLNPTMDAQTFTESAEAQKNLILGEGGDVSGVGTMTRERWQTLIDQLLEHRIVDGHVHVLTSLDRSAGLDVVSRKPS